MKIYYNTTFKGNWPVGTAAIVRADTAQEAANILNFKLSQLKLYQDVPVKAAEMYEFSKKDNCIILQDGEY